MISIIAAIGKKREIGKNGGLVFRIPEDMRYFKEMTTGHKVLMGRKTWESLPKKLMGRENIVVSSGDVTGADAVVRDIDGFLRENVDTPEEIFVMGGGQVYEAALPYARNLYLTEVDAEVPDADTYFPKFNKEQYRKKIIREGKENGMAFCFVCYEKEF